MTAPQGGIPSHRSRSQPTKAPPAIVPENSKATAP